MPNMSKCQEESPKSAVACGVKPATAGFSGAPRQGLEYGFREATIVDLTTAHPQYHPMARVAVKWAAESTDNRLCRAISMDSRHSSNGYLETEEGFTGSRRRQYD
jgi:hypothetical protein